MTKSFWKSESIWLSFQALKLIAVFNVFDIQVPQGICFDSLLILKKKTLVIAPMAPSFHQAMPMHHYFCKNSRELRRIDRDWENLEKMEINISIADYLLRNFPKLPKKSQKLVARGRGFANLLFTQLCWRLTRSALLCYSDG